MTCTPILGQAFRFQVSSRSRPDHFHIVDWLAVSCSCETFAYKNRLHREAHGKNYVCAHMQAAKDSCWEEILEHSRIQLLAQ